MGKKIVIPEEKVKEIIGLYVEENIGTPTLSKMFNYHKSIINRTLKENGVTLDTPGRRFLGGKKVSDAKYYKNNKNKILTNYKKWSQKNREHIKNYHSKWRELNRDKVNQKSKDWVKKRCDIDPQYKLNKNVRTAISISLKEKNIKKYGKTFDYLPYKLEELVHHLETQFKEGMSWDNYGDWHVDHIIPLSNFSFTDIKSDSFEECWSLSNLQPMWAKENMSKNNRVVAHQYKIRLQKEVEERDKINFDYESLDLKNSIVKEITRKQCEEIINEYEWLGYLPKYTKHHFGLFFNINGIEHLGGVVATQPEYGNNIGVWDKYGYTDKIIQLSRGVCLWWTPKNSASYMISKVLKWLIKNTEYEVVSSTVDSNAGEIGTIYQSLGWFYVGVMGGNLTKNGKERIRYGYKINGKIYNQRHIRKMIGTASKDEVLKHFPDVEILNMGRKKRYFKFIKNQETHLDKIKYMLKPYPKRK